MTYGNFVVAAEAQVAEKLVKDALAAGYSISVHEGEDWAIRSSTDKDAIMRSMCSTGEDRLYFHGSNGKSVGWVWFIWNNGSVEEVFTDYVANPIIERLVAGAEKLAAELSV